METGATALTPLAAYHSQGNEVPLRGAISGICGPGTEVGHVFVNSSSKRKAGCPCSSRQDAND